jgi:hypothetical protein
VKVEFDLVRGHFWLYDPDFAECNLRGANA